MPHRAPKELPGRPTSYLDHDRKEIFSAFRLKLKQDEDYERRRLGWHSRQFFG